MKKQILLITLTLALFACNNNAGTANNNEANNEDVEVTEENSTAFIQNAFPKLYEYYKKSDTAFNTQNFEEAQVTPIDSVASYPVNKAQLEAFYPYFIYNSDSSLAVDLYSYNFVLSKRNNKIRADQGGPDTEVAIIDVKNNTRRRIFFSGPAISLLEAKWLDNNTVLLAGVESAEGDSSKPILLKANLSDKTIQWFVHNQKIETDVSDYPEEYVFNKLN